MLACYDRETPTENGLFQLPRGVSELVRQTGFIIQLSCNCKFKDRLEPCITERGLKERTNSCTFVSWIFSHKITLCEWWRKNSSEPSDYLESFVNHTVLSALSWQNSSSGAGGKKDTEIGLGTVVPSVNRLTESRLPLVCPVSIFSQIWITACRPPSHSLLLGRGEEGVEQQWMDLGQK